ncbi:hypothetical protein [Nocardioides sp. YR527]|uniref:hypothetical protein n=1 Tax=Nocardioides sp. YR527 TaxID=1881028 RepID=UPI00115F9F43|nr:hypothetical protein [Nocardioides sp. YR527]
MINTYVRPFYLRAEWLPHDWTMARRVARAGKRVKLGDVQRMLHGTWRESSVAAWYCLRLPPESVTSDLEFALGHAYSSKNAHTLAAAAVALLGPRALPMLESAPCLIDAEPGDDGAGVVAAAIEEIGGTPPIRPDDGYRAWFQGLLRAARDLQVAYRDVQLTSRTSGRCPRR